MLVYLLAMIVITGIGAIAYLTNDLFGCQSSGTGPLPIHYRHLLRKADKKDEFEDLPQGSNKRTR